MTWQRRSIIQTTGVSGASLCPFPLPGDGDRVGAVWWLLCRTWAESLFLGSSCPSSISSTYSLPRASEMSEEFIASGHH